MIKYVNMENDSINEPVSPYRSQLMSKVGHKDTNIEIRLRSELHKRGLRFRKNVSTLPGSPDIVLPKYKAVIFVHGCFWHGHIGCKKGHLPAIRKNYWENKITENQERDTRKIEELTNRGWRVAVVWGCALDKQISIEYNIETLEKWIKSEENFCEIPVAQ